MLGLLYPTAILCDGIRSLAAVAVDPEYANATRS